MKISAHILLSVEIIHVMLDGTRHLIRSFNIAHYAGSDVAGQMIAGKRRLSPRCHNWMLQL